MVVAFHVPVLPIIFFLNDMARRKQGRSQHFFSDVFKVIVYFAMVNQGCRFVPKETIRHTDGTKNDLNIDETRVWRL